MRYPVSIDRAQPWPHAAPSVLEATAAAKAAAAEGTAEGAVAAAVAEKQLQVVLGEGRRLKAAAAVAATAGGGRPAAAGPCSYLKVLRCSTCRTLLQARRDSHGTLHASAQ